MGGEGDLATQRQLVLAGRTAQVSIASHFGTHRCTSLWHLPLANFAAKVFCIFASVQKEAQVEKLFGMLIWVEKPGGKAKTQKRKTSFSLLSNLL